MRKIFIAFVLTSLCIANLHAQPSRSRQTINDNWRFLNDGIAFGQHDFFVQDELWQVVNLPHTWNSEDPFDDVKSYKRGLGWYRRHLKLSKEQLNGKRAFLHFEGANQVTDLFVNSIMIGRHKGGYTAFTFDITDALNETDDQLIAVSVNNAHDPYIAPLSVGYALYGGIYRDVWLVITDNIHFDLSDYGSSGIKIKTPKVSREVGTVSVSSGIVNDGLITQEVEITTQIINREGQLIVEKSTSESLLSDGKMNVEHSLKVDKPSLWSPDSPYLYSVLSILKVGGKEVDRVENPLGFRWFSFDANEGFSLNGQHLKLRGTNRHQDFKGKGSALSNEDHRRDMEIIKNMGCNFIRIAHYPQDPEILRAADELGLIAWEEVPLVNYMNIHPEFYSNSVNMLREMIRQHYNHPAVVMWGSMNEIFLWGSNEARIGRQADTAYAHNVRKVATRLDSVIRSEDPGRYSTMAMHMNTDYERYGIENIPQVASFNCYNGWYGGVFEGFGRSFDRMHKRKPEQIIMISEYGAGSDKRLNSEKTKRFDFTSKYQIAFHESHLRQINERKFIVGSALWNQFDFSQPHTGGSLPHMNQKGVATWDRQLKDVYFMYKANWNPEPMVYIAEKDWPIRATMEANPSYNIYLYANTKSVDLYLNGKKLGTKQPNDIKKIVWKVRLGKGENVLRAVSKIGGKFIEDFSTITIENMSASDAGPIRINAGSNAQYLDSRSNPWIEDVQFNGVYGYSQGTPTLLNRKYIIRGSEHDPMYYTYLEDVKDYKIKLPNGTYETTLYFLEYQQQASGTRVFSVSVNGSTMIDKLDLTKEAGFCYGVERTFTTKIENGEMKFDFKALSGKTTLSGMKVVKIN